MLNKQEFRDATCMRYGWKMAHPMLCLWRDKLWITASYANWADTHTSMRHNSVRQ